MRPGQAASLDPEAAGVGPACPLPQVRTQKRGPCPVPARREGVEPDLSLRGAVLKKRHRNGDS
jgi:hypothetical protein